MEISRKVSVEITDVRGVEELTRDDLVVTFRLTEGRTGFSLLEIQGIRDALTAVLGPGTPNTEGPWERIEDVPADVQRVIDKEGDFFTRQSIDGPGEFAGETFDYLNKYAPFTRG